MDASKMNRVILSGLAALSLLLSCKREAPSPRPTIPLVLEIAADTSGAGGLAAKAGSRGADGSIAIIGEPSDVLTLARRFQSCDLVDNVDGRSVRDSLPDFAGETFDAILDVFNTPYAHFLAPPVQPDSLREAAVRAAVSAWDSLAFRSPADKKAILKKSQAKILIFTSSLQAAFGLFDVDTLQQITGGKSRLLSPVDVMLEDALATGQKNLAVWTTREAREADVWENAFAVKDPTGEARLSVLVPDAALDVRTELRNLLRQYQGTGRTLDVLMVDRFDIDPAPLASELAMIRRAGTEEDAAFDRMLSPGFRLLTPAQSLIRSTYDILRGQRLFTHRIARPAIRYYETVEGAQGHSVLMEVAPAYVQSTYVSDIN